MTITELVVAVHDRLTAARISHAFGGALALAQVAEPRGTVDVDVNVFTDVEEVTAVLDALAPLELRPELDQADWVPVSGIRLRSPVDPFPVDLFPALDPAYAEIEQRVIVRPFGPDRADLPFLAARDLALFKLSFGRAKDWVDLAAIARAVPDLDVDGIEAQLVALRGPTMYPRVVRLRQLLRTTAG